LTELAHKACQTSDLFNMMNWWSKFRRWHHCSHNHKHCRANQWVAIINIATQ